MANNLRVQLILDTINKASAPLKAITRDGGKTAEALKASQQQLKALKAQQRDISSFRKLQEATQKSGDKLKEQQQKAADLARQLSATAKPTKKLQKEFERAKEAAQKLKRSHQDNKQSLEQLSRKLHQTGIRTKNLDRHENALTRQMRQANSAIDEQKRKLEALGKVQQRAADIAARAKRTRKNAMKLAGHSTAALGGGAMALSGMNSLMHSTANAQASGSLVAARQGQTSSQATAYTDIINNIKAGGNMAEINEIAISLDAAASAFGKLGDTSGKNLQRITRDALSLSSTFGTDVSEAIQMAQIMVQNGLASGAGEAFDLITGGMQQVTARMRGELPEILHEYSTHFRGMGFNGHKAMNLLIKMADQGKFALDKTGDAIKEFSLRGSDMSKASVEAYEQIGLNAQQMSDAIASGGPDAQQALQATARGLLALTNPAERANAAIALFGTPIEDLSIDKIPDFLKALGGTQDVLANTDGAASRLSKTLRDNLNGDFGKLAGAWSGLKSQLFNQETGTLRELVQQLTGVVQQVTGWARENPELAAGLVKFAAVLAIVVTAMGALGLAVSSLMLGWSVLLNMAPVLGMFKALGPVVMTLGKAGLPWVAAGFTKAGGAISKLLPYIKLIGTSVLYVARMAIPAMLGALKTVTMFLLTNPIGLAIAAIAGAAYLIYRNWEPIKAFFMGLWQQVTNAFNGGLAGIGALLVNWSPIGLIYSAIRKGLAMLGIELPAKFTDFGGMLIDGLINGLTAKWDALKSSISGIAESVSGWFKDTLGIRSPSRVFISHGSDVMAGLEQGLQDNNSTLKPVQEISQELTKAGAAMALPTPATQPAIQQAQQQLKPTRQIQQALPVQQPMTAALQQPAVAQPATAPLYSPIQQPAAPVQHNLQVITAAAPVARNITTQAPATPPAIQQARQQLEPTRQAQQALQQPAVAQPVTTPLYAPVQQPIAPAQQRLQVITTAAPITRNITASTAVASPAAQPAIQQAQQQLEPIQRARPVPQHQVPQPATAQQLHRIQQTTAHEQRIQKTQLPAAAAAPPAPALQWLQPLQLLLAPLKAISTQLIAAGTSVAIASPALSAPPILDNRPPLQSARPAPAAAPSLHIGEIHIHAAPGMDEQALAQRVVAEIERREQLHVAGLRSSLRDDD